MSGGVPCTCKPKDRAQWVVTARRGNASAFNGYRWTASSYSEVRCTVCRGVWRTKAAYVMTLKDAPR